MLSDDDTDEDSPLVDINLSSPAPHVENDDRAYLKCILTIVMSFFIGLHYVYLIYTIYYQHNINVIFIYILIFLFMTIFAICVILTILSMKSLLLIVRKKIL